MKKTIVLAIIVFIAVIKLNAQAENRFWVGGTAKVWFSKNTPDKPEETVFKTRNFYLFPEVGYLLNDRWGVGINIGYGYTKNTADREWNINTQQSGIFYNRYTQDTGISKSYTIAPFVRFTVLRGKLGGIFADGIVSYGQMRTEYTYTSGTREYNVKKELINTNESSPSTSDSKTATFSVGITPGVSLNISDRVSLIGKFGFFGYATSDYKSNLENFLGNTESGGKNDNVSLSLDLNSISFGAIVNF